MRSLVEKEQQLQRKVMISKGSWEQALYVALVHR
jgi:hypothetical protein